MKSRIITLITFLFFAVALHAQDKTAETKKSQEEVTFVVGMHCEACKKRIESAIPFEKGVKDLNVNLDKKEVTIIYKTAKTNVDKLKKAIEELGYTCKEKSPVQSDSKG
ncbi:MAG: heavy-metal-associated domain-containing protein [Bacteroidota bacterium]|nr:heavy-metal-associated domain-containing protein [Bacteroidota bacterium]